MKSRSWKERLNNSDTFWGYLFLLPIICGFLIFTIVPVVLSFYYSLTEYNGIAKPVFVGLKNYIDIFKNQEFLSSLGNTFKYTIGYVPLCIIISLLVACMLNQKIRFINVYRSAFFIPYIVSLVAVAIVWQWMYQPDYGLINSFLAKFGIQGPPWLASSTWAMPSVIIMSVWKNLGFNMVLFMAGLQGISPSLYEAADMDGATGVKKFFHITIPLLKNTTVFALIMSMISALQAFDQIYIMTRGGPAKSTQVVVYLIYQNAFEYFKQGYSSAMAYVLFIIIFVVSILQLWWSERKDKQ